MGVGGEVVCRLCGRQRGGGGMPGTPRFSAPAMPHCCTASAQPHRKPRRVGLQQGRLLPCGCWRPHAGVGTNLPPTWHSGGNLADIDLQILYRHHARRGRQADGRHHACGACGRGWGWRRASRGAVGGAAGAAVDTTPHRGAGAPAWGAAAAVVDRPVACPSSASCRPCLACLQQVGVKGRRGV